MKPHDIRSAKVSEAVRKLNPHLFVVGGFQPKIAQQKAGGALVGKSSGRQTGGGCVAGGAPVVRVSLTNFRRRLMDSDNLIGGYKPLRDGIARSMCLDDADTVIEWEYAQQLTRGKEGTVVRIEY